MINLIVIPQNQKLADLSQNLKVATKNFHSVENGDARVAIAPPIFLELDKMIAFSNPNMSNQNCSAPQNTFYTL